MNKSDDPLAKNTPADDGIIIASIENDNLQIIEGIGPAMEKVLHKNGITTWKALGQHSIADVKGILDKYGDKYNVIDPASWIDQAKMAAKGDVDGIIQMQKDDGSISKLEKLLKPTTKIKKQPPTKKRATTKKTAKTKVASKTSKSIAKLATKKSESTQFASATKSNKATKNPVSGAKSTVAKAKVAKRTAPKKSIKTVAKPVKQRITKNKPGKKATANKKVLAKSLAKKPLTKKKPSTKKQSRPQAVITDSPLDQTIDLNSPHLPIHPERIWPD